MTERDLIVTKAELLSLCGNNIPIKEAYINDCSCKYVDIYCVAEDKNTKEEFKMKVRMEGQQNITFSYVTDKEYNEAIG